MVVKTILGSVLAVAVGSAALGFASKYRSDSCSNEAKQGIAAIAATSKECVNSPEGEFHGGCATNDDASVGTACCQSAALSKNVSSLSGHGQGDECLGSCAGATSESKDCCQIAAVSKSISQSGKGHEGECHGECAHGESSGAQKCCQDAEKTIGIVASPK